MQKNIGTADRWIRVVLALVFLYIGWKYNPWWYVLTVVLLLTAIFRHCCLYTLLHISTDKKKAKGRRK